MGASGFGISETQAPIWFTWVVDQRCPGAVGSWEDCAGGSQACSPNPKPGKPYLYSGWGRVNRQTDGQGPKSLRPIYLPFPALFPTQRKKGKM